MRIPHDKCLLSVAKIAFPLLLSHAIQIFLESKCSITSCIPILPDPDIFTFDTKSPVTTRRFNTSRSRSTTTGAWMLIILCKIIVLVVIANVHYKSCS